MADFTLTYGTGFQIVGPTSADDFSVSVTNNYVTSGAGSTVSTTEKDATYNMRQGTTQTTTCTLSAYNNPTYTNLNPEVGTLTDGVVTPVGSGGTCVIAAYKWGIGTRHYTASPQVQVTSNYQYTPTSFTAGSVMRHVYDTIVNAMAATPGLTGLSHRRFNVTEAPVGSPSGTINTSMWMHGVCDFTPVGYSRQVTDATNPSYTQSYVLPAILVHDGTAASKFAVIATHVSGSSLPAGSTVNFLRSDNTFATMTTAAAPLVISGDLSLIMFTSTVSGIEGIKTLGDDFLTKIPLWGPKINSPYGVSGPALFIGGQWATSDYPSYSASNVRTCKAMYAGNGNPFGADNATLSAVFDSRAWTVDVGDSSGLTAIPVNGKLVGLGTQYTAGGGPSIVDNRNAISAGMCTLAGAASGTYTMGVVDLSGFTTY